MYDGTIHYFNKTYIINVWPVRAGQDNSPNIIYPANIWKTGQTITYAQGDDGEIQAGVAWPNPRFGDQGNGPVVDNLTGLAWTKDPYTPGPYICNPGIHKTWQDALDHVACLNTNIYLGYNDWRLPNRKELESLFDYSQWHPALPAGYPFAGGNLSDSFWSSTTYISWAKYAYHVHTDDGPVFNYLKGGLFYVWPVRGGDVTRTVEIDFKPGSSLNNINPKSKGKIPVAILSTQEFYAPDMVNKDSLTFGATGFEDSLAFCNEPEDINGDGLRDLTCHFYTQEAGFQCGDTEGILMGETVGGTPIEGSDSVRIIPCNN